MEGMPCGGCSRQHAPLHGRRGYTTSASRTSGSRGQRVRQAGSFSVHGVLRLVRPCTVCGYGVPMSCPDVLPRCAAPVCCPGVLPRPDSPVSCLSCAACRECASGCRALPASALCVVHVSGTHGLGHIWSRACLMPYAGGAGGRLAGMACVAPCVTIRLPAGGRASVAPAKRTQFPDEVVDAGHAARARKQHHGLAAVAQ